MAVSEFQSAEGTRSPPTLSVQVAGEGSWRLKGAPPSVSTWTPDAERLTFELWARLGETQLFRLSDLGFEMRHPRCWDALPTDSQLYTEAGKSPETNRAELWQAASDPRFPLAGNAAPNVLYLPLAMSPLANVLLGADALARTPLERDGLDRFDASLFLDGALSEVGVLDLTATADYIHYTSPAPRSLCGIHAAFGIDEATVIAVPDAIHRGWQQNTVEPPPEPFVSPPLPRPAWWHFLDCAPDPNQPAPAAPSGDSYPGARPDLVLPPWLDRQERTDNPGLLVLTWSWPMLGMAQFILEEATQPDFGDASPVYSGQEHKALIYGRLPGDYYYHVRAVTNGTFSDWSNALVVRVPVNSVPLVSQPSWGEFLDCPLIIITPPFLTGDGPNTAGMVTLRWTGPAGSAFILEEATARDFEDAVEIYSGADAERMIYGRSPGDYYYRVLADVDGISSDWSNGIAIRISPPLGWVLTPTEQYAPGGLLAIQRALLRMCAARGDLFAVLAMPEHYREDAAIAHAAALTSPGLDFVGADDTRTFSFGAAYHPWLFALDEPSTATRRMPPDGAISGVFAQRAFNRGAWIAPANEPLNAVVALTPPIERDRWLDLQEAQINLIRQEARGFLSLSSDTLSADPDVRPINVRRLLMLLRRLAYKLGTSYVFEPNDDSFRRMVIRGFEAMLGEMFTRGAFAGNTPATSFQVVADSSLNTPQSIEQGRFIVELRVAPSLPLTFLTVRLVQTGDRISVTEAG